MRPHALDRSLGPVHWIEQSPFEHLSCWAGRGSGCRSIPQPFCLVEFCDWCFSYCMWVRASPPCFSSCKWVRASPVRPPDKQRDPCLAGRHITPDALSKHQGGGPSWSMHMCMHACVCICLHVCECVYVCMCVCKRVYVGVCRRGLKVTALDETLCVCGIMWVYTHGL